ncbi:MAG: hypothetical protein KC503_00670 [Myxococcales bacterium]|nr:hypothetical protein [Myxococcales bacterium]
MKKIKTAAALVVSVALAGSALLAAACDPVWSVRRDALPSKQLTTDCIKGALARAGATRVVASTSSRDATSRRVWFRLRGVGLAINYRVGAASPRRVEISTSGVGSCVAPQYLARIRSASEALLAHLQRSCGPIKAGPEKLSRPDCSR